METKLKQKCISSFICVIAGTIIVILALCLKNLSEMQISYLDGFGKSFAIASLALFIKNLMSLRNAKTIRDREIELTDERNLQIEKNSMAITFKISAIIEAFLSIILVVFMNNELGMYLGLLLTVQIVIYVISNVIISKKI